MPAQPRIDETVEYYRDRYHAHKKWMQIHGFLTAVSCLTIVGLLWAWIFFLRGLQHRRKAKQAKRSVDGPVV